MKPKWLSACWSLIFSVCLVFSSFIVDLGSFTFDVREFPSPPEQFRARELSAENLAQVKRELETKGTLGSRLEIICVVPPVSSSSWTLDFHFVVRAHLQTICEKNGRTKRRRKRKTCSFR